MNLEQMIEQAIRERCCMKIFYDGGERIVEPCCLGLSKRYLLSLRCWQRSGYSRSGKSEGWKFITVDKIEFPEILQEKFFPHEGYKRDDKGMTTIYAQL